jgi:hypothetical protein
MDLGDKLQFGSIKVIKSKSVYSKWLEVYYDVN